MAEEAIRVLLVEGGRVQNRPGMIKCADVFLAK